MAAVKLLNNIPLELLQIEKQMKSKHIYTKEQEMIGGDEEGGASDEEQGSERFLPSVRLMNAIKL